jgi:hypothetical protein
MVDCVGIHLWKRVFSGAQRSFVECGQVSEMLQTSLNFLPNIVCICTWEVFQVLSSSLKDVDFKAMLNFVI